MTTAPTTREDIKDRIGQTCSKIINKTIYKSSSSISAKIATMPTTRRRNILNIYWIDAKNSGKNMSKYKRQEDLH